MNLLLRGLLSLALGLLWWPEVARYRAEWQLAQAQLALQEVLTGRLPAQQGAEAASRGVQLALAALGALPGDARPPHIASIGLLMLRGFADAAGLLETAIRHGDRPELSLNLGRTRAASGDIDGARRAWLHTAWAQPAAIASLPAAEREWLKAQLPALEQALQSGRLEGLPPPL